MSDTDHILSTMQSISLAQMDAVRLLTRNDTKYVFGMTRLPPLLERMRSDYRVLSINEMRRFRYKTLYFDTQDHTCFLQHHNKKRTRRKYRIRQYASTGTCFLEVKTKGNSGRTEKRRIPLAGPEDPLSPSSRAFIESVTGQLPELTSQLCTSFTRITMVSRDQPERVTLDLDLEFSHGKLRQNLSGVIIAEVKQDRDDRHSLLREQLRQLHVRPIRVSKYCIGTVLLKPHLKCNRFKSTLRRIRAVV